MSRIILDDTSSASEKPGHTLVTSEVAFWQEALSRKDLHIRGKLLCDWAEAFYKGRRVTTHRERGSLVALRDICPDLSLTQAQRLLEKLGEAFSEREPLELRSVASDLLGQPFLLDAPSSYHAEKYLVWRLEAEPDEAEAEAVLLGALVKEYESAAAPSDAPLYKVGNRTGALEQLKSRLGWAGAKAERQPFSQALPEGAKRQLRAELRQQVTKDPLHFSALRESGADKALLTLAAEVSADYYKTHPEALSQTTFARLAPHLGSTQRDLLQNLLPVAAPPPVPRQSADLLEWFERAYLPYRLYPQHDKEIATQLGREFAEVYLGLYANALSGSSDQELLTWNKTNALRGKGSVTLLIVLDGLGLADAHVFANELRELDAQERLSLNDLRLAFAPLPSITRCSKPALETGLSPDRTDKEPIGLKLTKDAALTSTLQAASAGDIVIWSLTEPDSTYHKDKDLETVRNKARHALRSVAERLLKHIEPLDEAVPLEIIITTDHGRLLGSSSRSVRVPEGMVAEGRAATRESGQRFDETGFLIQGDLVYLDRERFRMKEDAAVVLSDGSFLTRDGRQGEDAFPHGGLFPEEVLVPWLTLARRFDLHPVAAQLSGSGDAERSAELTLTVSNPNMLSITVESLRLDFLVEPLVLEAKIGAMHTEAFQVSLTLPSERVAAAAQGQLNYQLPNGKLEQVTVEVAISSREMYAADNALEDLQ